jgi:hypothetical protein
MLQAISPTTAVAGSPKVTLTLRGADFVEGFISGSKAMWTANDSTTSLATTFVSSTQLTALVPAALLSGPDTALVFVENGDPEDGIPLTKSNALEFRVEAPPTSSPSVSAISPAGAVTGSPDLTLTIMGANFAGAPQGRSQAAWAANGDTTLLATTFVSSTQLTAVIPTALLSNPVTAQVLVETGDPMGDLPLSRSNAVGFTVARAGTIIVHGQTSTLPPIMKGSRRVSLDGGPFLVLTEGSSVIYSPVTPGAHRLLLSNPCTSTHQPSYSSVTVTEGDTVTVTVSIPGNCE